MVPARATRDPVDVLAMPDPLPDDPEPVTTMWDTLERARRRLLGDDLSDPTPPHGIPEPDERTNLAFALGRTELERLIAALGTLADTASGRADTPARLETALERAIAHVGGHGRPSVTRQPAGLYTPEAWQISVEDADRTTRSALERAIRNGGLDA
jgi:hypothetical protein